MKRCIAAALGLGACLQVATTEAMTVAPSHRILVVAVNGREAVLSCAGVIRNAVNSGSDVRLMLLSADNDEALERAVTVMSMLGVAKDKIAFLGYDGGLVPMCAYNHKDDTFAICPGRQHSQTYSPSPLLEDYHTAHWGVPADYNRYSILEDVRSVIDEFRPQDIFMPAFIEQQPALAATGLLTTEAIIALQEDDYYEPNVHQYIVYRAGFPHSSLNALEPVSNANSDLESTPYAWDEREAIPVPKEMYAPLEQSTNLKQLAFRGFLGWTENFTQYIKADEVFWRKRMASRSYAANVLASSERPDRPARNVIDGVALGAPFVTQLEDLPNFHDFAVHEWIANDATSGAYVKLAWNRPILANQAVIYDCPSPETQILAAELVLSDGLRIPVAALPNNGAPLRIEFPLRWISWAKLVVSDFAGTAPGLSEFEIYARPMAFPIQTSSLVSDTAFQANVIFPDSTASGNRLAWRLRGSDTWNYLWPDRHIKSGSYVINGLKPNSKYDILTSFDGPWGWPWKLLSSVMTAAPQPPPQPPVCRNCVYELVSVTADSITVTVAYPDSNAWGNRLIYSDLTTGVISDWGTPLEVHDGTYTITGLTPNNMYNIDIVYLDSTQPKPWIDNIYTVATLAQ